METDGRSTTDLLNLMPIFLVELSGDLDIDFEDHQLLDEIKENEYVQKFNKTIEQLAVIFSEDDA